MIVLLDRGPDEVVHAVDLALLQCPGLDEGVAVSHLARGLLRLLEFVLELRELGKLDLETGLGVEPETVRLATIAEAEVRAALLREERDDPLDAVVAAGGEERAVQHDGEDLADVAPLHLLDGAGVLRRGGEDVDDERSGLLLGRRLKFRGVHVHGREERVRVAVVVHEIEHDFSFRERGRLGP